MKVNRMASGLSSPLGIAGIIFIVIGIIMAIVGIIILIVNTNKEKPWYIWVLLIGGIVLGIAGGIMLAIALMNAEPSVTYCDDAYKGVQTQMKYVQVQQPMQPQVQVQPQPQAQVRYVNVVQQPQVQYAPVQQQSTVALPVSTKVSTRDIGYTVDPVPVTSTIRGQSTQQFMVTGPYGPGGAIIEVPATLTVDRETQVTRDVGPHQVNLLNPQGVGQFTM